MLIRLADIRTHFRWIRSTVGEVYQFRVGCDELNSHVVAEVNEDVGTGIVGGHTIRVEPT